MAAASDGRRAQTAIINRRREKTRRKPHDETRKEEGEEEDDGERHTTGARRGHRQRRASLIDQTNGCVICRHARYPLPPVMDAQRPAPCGRFLMHTVYVTLVQFRKTSLVRFRNSLVFKQDADFGLHEWDPSNRDLLHTFRPRDDLSHHLFTSSEALHGH